MRDKELENVIYLLNLFEASDWKEEEKQEKALDFLKSLKVKVPQYAADWYDTTYVYNGVGSSLKLHNQTKTWVEQRDMTLNQLVQDIKRFGYVVTNDFDEVYIKAPDKWSGEPSYLCLEEFGDEYSYELMYSKKDADTFERQEAIKLMEELGVNWELVEVKEYVR